ncbi:MAG: tetratricopeptide repeat protein [bacterium]|nr:tetratricopeptide repeat protein [bacterium]
MGRFDWLEMPDDKKKKKKESNLFEDKSAEAFMKRAEEELRTGNFDDALRYFSRALGEDSNLEDAWFWQTWILIQLNEIKEARTWVDKGLEKFPHSVNLLSAKGMLMTLLGDFDRAAAYLDSAIEKKGDAIFPWLYRGYLLLQEKPMRNFKHAQACFFKADEGWSKDWFFLCNIALAYIENNYPEHALEILERAKKQRINSPYLFYIESRAYTTISDFNKALDLISKALAISPRFEIGEKYKEYIERNMGISFRIKNFFKRIFRS